MVFWAKKKDYRKWYRGLYDGNKVSTENAQEVDMGLSKEDRQKLKEHKKNRIYGMFKKEL